MTRLLRFARRQSPKCRLRAHADGLSTGTRAEAVPSIPCPRLVHVDPPARHLGVGRLARFRPQPRQAAATLHHRLVCEQHDGAGRVHQVAVLAIGWSEYPVIHRAGSFASHDAGGTDVRGDGDGRLSAEPAHAGATARKSARAAGNKTGPRARRTTATPTAISLFPPDPGQGYYDARGCGMFLSHSDCNGWAPPAWPSGAFRRIMQPCCTRSAVTERYAL